MKNLSILGSTGSVGKSTLEVVRRNAEKFQINLLTANTNFSLMLDQIEEFGPKFVFLEDTEAQKSLLRELEKTKINTTLLTSEDQLMEVLADKNSEIVVACLLYTSPSPRDGFTSRMPSSA